MQISELERDAIKNML